MFYVNVTLSKKTYHIEKIEVTRRRGRRRKKLLDDLKDRKGYCQLKEEALDRTMWRNHFGRGFGPVVWQITDDDVMDLPFNIRGAKMVMFADDTNIQPKATNEAILNQKLHRVMQQLLIWFHVNGLEINTEKTIAMYYPVPCIICIGTPFHNQSDRKIRIQILRIECETHSSF